MNSNLRRELVFVLDKLLNLEHGIALLCPPITDPDQRKVLGVAKSHLMAALAITEDSGEAA